MASTTYVELSAAVRGIGARTDAAAAAVDDISAEEDRFAHQILTEGALSDAAFLVQPDTGMDLEVGSGAAKTDYYVVAGEAAGQGNYIARLDAATVAVTVPAAEPASARTDEIYLVIADAPYDSGSLSLPRIGYREGDPGGAAPGPDAGWKASAKIASIAVAAAATSIAAGDITDTRDFAFVRPPAGTLGFWPSSTLPTGALLRDGSAVSRTTYRRLFRIIGTTFGAGDGSTTFNLPDAEGRVDVGRDAAQAEFDTLGETGGAKTHTLTEAEMPAHDHGAVTGEDGEHTHSFDDASVANGSAVLTRQSAGVSTSTTTTAEGDHTHTVASDGGGGAHNNLQPYIVSNPIIWT